MAKRNGRRGGVPHPGCNHIVVMDVIGLAAPPKCGRVRQGAALPFS